MTMKTILVPTDFSKAADNALKIAKIIARRTNSTIHVANFYSIPVVDYSYPDVSISAEIMEQNRKAAIHNMEELVKELKFDAYTVNTTVEMGLIAEETVALANEINADLIVMGTTGASGFLNKIMGSNAARVMQRTVRPILLIPEKSTINEINDVVYLDQFESDDTDTMVKLFSFGEDIGFKNIKILNVNTNFFFKPISGELLELLKRTFGENKVKLETVDAVDVKEGIDKYLAENNVDLIVMSTNKKTFLERIFAKSNTQEMALYSNLPLLVYHKE